MYDDDQNLQHLLFLTNAANFSNNDLSKVDKLKFNVSYLHCAFYFRPLWDALYIGTVKINKTFQLLIYDIPATKVFVGSDSIEEFFAYVIRLCARFNYCVTEIRCISNHYCISGFDCSRIWSTFWFWTWLYLVDLLVTSLNIAHHINEDNSFRLESTTLLGR